MQRQLQDSQAMTHNSKFGKLLTPQNFRMYTQRNNN
jgi:hypothetical protein